MGKGAPPFFLACVRLRYTENIILFLSQILLIIISFFVAIYKV